MRHVSALLFLGLVLAGCATPRQPVYSFDCAAPYREAWTRSYAADRGTRSLQGEFVNARTDAKVSVYRDAFRSPTPADAARAYRAVYEGRGFSVPGDRIAVAAGRASFPIEDAERGLKGEVVALRVGEERRNVVLVGIWPAENDPRASADMRSLVNGFSVSAVE